MRHYLGSTELVRDVHDVIVANVRARAIGTLADRARGELLILERHRDV
jgi:hypothetical protein